jgi:hypothetical protein
MCERYVPGVHGTCPQVHPHERGLWCPECRTDADALVRRCGYCGAWAWSTEPCGACGTVPDG